MSQKMPRNRKPKPNAAIQRLRSSSVNSSGAVANRQREFLALIDIIVDGNTGTFRRREFQIGHEIDQPRKAHQQRARSKKCNENPGRTPGAAEVIEQQRDHQELGYRMQPWSRTAQGPSAHSIPATA